MAGRNRSCCFFGFVILKYISLSILALFIKYSLKNRDIGSWGENGVFWGVLVLWLLYLWLLQAGVPAVT